MTWVAGLSDADEVSCRVRAGEIARPWWSRRSDCDRAEPVRLHPKDSTTSSCRRAHLPGSPAPAERTALLHRPAGFGVCGEQLRGMRSAVTLGMPDRSVKVRGGPVDNGKRWISRTFAGRGGGPVIHVTGPAGRRP